MPPTQKGAAAAALDADPRRPDDVHQFSRKHPEEVDGIALIASVAAMGGMMLRQKYLSYAALFLALATFAQGKTHGFPWQQFLSALAFSVFGIWATTMAELAPAPQGGAAAASPAAAAAAAAAAEIPAS